MTVSRYAVLAALRQAPNSSCNDIAYAVGCSPATVTKVMQKFVESGHVVRLRQKRSVRAPYAANSSGRREVSVLVYRAREGLPASVAMRTA